MMTSFESEMVRKGWGRKLCIACRRKDKDKSFYSNFRFHHSKIPHVQTKCKDTIVEDGGSFSERWGVQISPALWVGSLQVLTTMTVNTVLTYLMSSYLCADVNEH